MHKEFVFASLRAQPPKVWLKLLDRAFERMNREEREVVFGEFLPKGAALPDAETTLRQVEQFRKDSWAGVYYEHGLRSGTGLAIPPETIAWFDDLDVFLGDSMRLSQQGEHAAAVTCFAALYELIGAIECGEKIVYAEAPVGSLYSGASRRRVAAYLLSLAVTATPQEFVAVAMRVIECYEQEPCARDVYRSACRVATRAQRELLDVEIAQRQIKIKPGAPRKRLKA